MANSGGKRYSTLIAATVSLGGFLFGFDASVISGVIGYVGPQFGLTDLQQGWVVGSPSFAAMFAMLGAGILSDRLGRKKVLIAAALLYTLSAILSALATTYEVLVIARMIGGLAFGTALVIAPLYIGEIAPSEARGKLVSIQQLNIVLGFSASYFSNFMLLENIAPLGLHDETIWRWMLGIEALPAVAYFFLMFLVPESPRWLWNKGAKLEATAILSKVLGADRMEEATREIDEHAVLKRTKSKPSFSALLSKEMRLIVFIALTLAIVQQVTGINSILFYAATIFEQSGVGKNAAFAQAVLVGLVQVVFTVVTILAIDKIGRKPLLLIGLGGIAISMLLCFFGFNNASYKLTDNALANMPDRELRTQLTIMEGRTFESDLSFKREVIRLIGEDQFRQHESQLLEMAARLNAPVVLAGILLFMAAFSISVGPVMWVLFSEIFPSKIKGIGIATFGFLNSFTSFLVQLVFPWEIQNLGNAMTYLLFGLFAVIGLLILARILPETKGKTLEQLESMLIKK